MFIQRDRPTKIDNTLDEQFFPAKVENIHGSKSILSAPIRLIIFIFQIFGLAPYKLDDDGRLVTSSIYLIVSLVCICIHTFLTYFIFLEFWALPWEGALSLVERTKFVLNYSLAVLDILLSVLRREKFAKLWNALRNSDKKFKDLCYEINENEIKVWIWSVIILNLIVWVAINQFGMAVFNETWLRNMSYMIVYVASAMTVTKFSAMVLLLSRRFRHLNEIVKMATSSTSNSFRINPRLDTAVIEEIHRILIDIGEELASMYSWQIILWLANLCLHIVSDLYLAKYTKWGGSFCLISWMVNFFWQLWLLISSCHFASDEASRKKYIMLGFQRSTNDVLLYVNHRELIFTAAGCFIIDLTLLTKVIGYGLTLLVILLQMS